MVAKVIKFRADSVGVPAPLEKLISGRAKICELGFVSRRFTGCFRLYILQRPVDQELQTEEGCSKLSKSVGQFVSGETNMTWDPLKL